MTKIARENPRPDGTRLANFCRKRLGEDSPFVQGFGKTIHPHMLTPANANPGFQAARLETMTGDAHEDLARRGQSG